MRVRCLELANEFCKGGAQVLRMSIVDKRNALVKVAVAMGKSAGGSVQGRDGFDGGQQLDC